MKVSMLYFAQFREKTGKSSEEIETTATNLDELYKEIEKRYSLDFPLQNLRFAVNENYVANGTAIKDGDKIAIIPPIAGG